MGVRHGFWPWQLGRGGLAEEGVRGRSLGPGLREAVLMFRMGLGSHSSSPLPLPVPGASSYLSSNPVSALGLARGTQWRTEVALLSLDTAIENLLTELTLLPQEQERHTASPPTHRQ